MNNGHTADEIARLVREGVGVALERTGSRSGPREQLRAVIGSWLTPEDMYVPDETLTKRIEDYVRWCKTKKGENPGQLLEEIVFLAFRCLRGCSDLKSYQSFSSQMDLVAGGEDHHWIILLTYLHLNLKQRFIIVEVKNQRQRVNDQQFSRVCWLLEDRFRRTSELGVIVARAGATGFPDRKSTKSRRCLEGAQATQLFYYAEKRKFVIVLEHEDIIALGKPGALVRLLETRIRAVEHWTGATTSVPTRVTEVELPAHLRQYVMNNESPP